MGRRIIVFADGTGNSAAKAFKTNVWRLYEALDLAGGKQLAVFADGVGTSGFKPFAIVGLALGFGVKRRVLALYKFLCLNFTEGDEIFVFGFSRGAFIARVLVGLIGRQGLVSSTNQEELDRNALAAYRVYRAKAFPDRLPWVRLSRMVRDLWAGGVNAATGAVPYEDVRPKAGPYSAAEIKIRFLGVWDTVAAYGLPVEELTRAVNACVWPLTFTNHTLLPCVQTARQALSLDDERRTFFPIPFNESDATTAGDYPRLRQVWFAGTHSNVGGGYPDDRLSYLSLVWMIGEATESGLKFRPEIVADYVDRASESGRIYDSRANVSLFYRYHPRSTANLMGRKLLPVEVVKPQVEPGEDGEATEVEWQPIGEPVVPLIDGSVIQRMVRGSDGYAPVSLPESFSVLSPRGAIIPFRVSQPVDVDPEEVPRGKAADRVQLPDDRKRDLNKAELSLRSALNAMRGQNGYAHTSQLKLTMDTVWWRRVVYFATLSAVMIALAFPLLGGYLTDERVDRAINGVIGPVVGLLGGILPGFVMPWLNAVANNGYPALALISVIALTLWLNSHLRRRIRDRAMAAWNVGAAKRNANLADDRVKANRRMSLIGSVVSFAIALISLSVWGFGGDGESGDFNWPAAVFAGLGVASFVSYAFASRADRAGRRQPRRHFLLGIARSIRENSVARAVYRAARDYVVPGIFLIGAAYLSIAVLNKISYQVFAAAGEVCPRIGRSDQGVPQQDDARLPQDLVATGTFKLSDGCWNSGIRLDGGVTYRIKLRIAEPWLDRGERSDVRGFLAGDAKTESPIVYFMFNPFKRHWSEPWFKPIARIGRRGNEEYVLNPLQPERRQSATVDTLFAVIKPERPGPLYIFVNDAAVGVPGLFHRFYRNNHGTAEVEVDRVDIKAFD